MRILKSTHKNCNFQERSEVAKAVILHKPNFFERWALWIFIIVLMGLLGAALFIQLPDIVSTRGVLKEFPVDSSKEMRMQKYFFEIKIQRKDVSKILVGMNVQIDFIGSDSKNSLIYGRLTHISKIPIDNSFRGIVELSDILPFDNSIINRSGYESDWQANIITQKVTILSKVKKMISKLVNPTRL